MCRHLSNEWQVRTLGSQLLRSGTAVAANDRAAYRGLLAAGELTAIFAASYKTAKENQRKNEKKKKPNVIPQAASGG
jgi:hypothetical protein